MFPTTKQRISYSKVPGKYQGREFIMVRQDIDEEEDNVVEEMLILMVEQLKWGMEQVNEWVDG